MQLILKRYRNCKIAGSQYTAKQNKHLNYLFKCKVNFDVAI